MLFGRATRPKVVHLKARRVRGAVILTWDVRRAKALRWRVLRSENGPADRPFDDTVIGSGQSLVSDQATPGSHDEPAGGGGALHYSIFAEDERGQWRRAAVARVAAVRGGRAAEGDFEASPGSTQWLDAGWAARAGSGDNPGRP